MTIALAGVKFGTDAEFFLRTSTGTPIPVCGMLGGTKEEPKPLPGLGAGYAVQEDNAAAEFNIPATNRTSVFAKSVARTLIQIQEMLPKAVKLDYDSSSLVFNDEYLKIPELSRFGCEPDYNAWTMKTNDRPKPHLPGFRSAAAHMHIGWDDPTDEDKLQLIRLADIYAVLPTIAKQTESEEARRTLYGQAGAFRMKPYGVEHRVLSNQWAVKAVPYTLHCYLNAILALNSKIEIDGADFERVVLAINKPHPKLAIMLYEKYVRALQKAMGPEFSFQSYYASFY